MSLVSGGVAGDVVVTEPIASAAPYASVALPRGSEDDDEDAAPLTDLEIEMSTPPPDETMRLYLFSEIPDRLRDNPYIIGAYRARYTARMCLRSLLTLHNETVNVFTHLLGLIGLLSYIAYVIVTVVDSEAVHRLMFAIFALGLGTCLFCSAAFHLFNAHWSRKVCKTMHKLDYFGVTALILGSFFVLIYFAFECKPTLRIAYMSMIGVLGAVGLFGPWFHIWTEHRFYAIRIAVYVFMVGSGVAPIIHVNFVLPKSQTLPFAEALAVEIAMYATGLTIYVAKIPERFFPDGSFDVWLHSHQVWHMLINCAAALHLFISLSIYVNWRHIRGQC